MSKNKIYPFHQTLNVENVFNKFETFKYDLQNDKTHSYKHISLTIQLMNDQEVFNCVENYNINISNTYHKELKLHIKSTLKMFKILLKDQVFNEIQFTFSEITYKDYISLDETKKLLRDRMHRRNK